MRISDFSIRLLSCAFLNLDHRLVFVVFYSCKHLEDGCLSIPRYTARRLFLFFILKSYIGTYILGHLCHSHSGGSARLLNAVGMYLPTYLLLKSIVGTCSLLCRFISFLYLVLSAFCPIICRSFLLQLFQFSFRCLSAALCSMPSFCLVLLDSLLPTTFFL